MKVSTHLEEEKTNNNLHFKLDYRLGYSVTCQWCKRLSWLGSWTSDDSPEKLWTVKQFFFYFHAFLAFKVVFFSLLTPISALCPTFSLPLCIWRVCWFCLFVCLPLQSGDHGDAGVWVRSDQAGRHFYFKTSRVQRWESSCSFPAIPPKAKSVTLQRSFPPGCGHWGGEE